MSKNFKRKFRAQAKGFTIIEVLVAIGLFVLIVGGAVGAVAQAFLVNRLGEEESYANFLASEGLEGVRAIAARDYFNLVNGSYGLKTTSGFWEFSGSSETFSKYTRSEIISNVYRDGSGNIVASGGTLDLYTKRVESKVSWNFSPGRPESVSLKSYFSFWQQKICEWGNTSALNQVGGLDLPGKISATDIEIANNVGYVTGGSSSNQGVFFTLNLSNPINPTISGSITNLSSVVNSVSVSGNFAYLATADLSKTLLVVNVSNPSSPVIVGSSGVAGGAGLAVATADKFAYLGVANNSGPEFYIYDVSNPSSPTVVGTFNAGKDVTAISVKNNRAYLAVTTTGSGQSSLLVLDVSNPQNPVQIGSFINPNAPPGAKGTSVVYAGGIVHLTILGSSSVPLYYLLDASDPSNISLLGDLPAQGGMEGINGVDAGSGFALLATNKASAAIIIVDITNPNNPTAKISYSLGGGANGLGAKINGCYAYVASSDSNQEIKVVAPK